MLDVFASHEVCRPMLLALVLALSAFETSKAAPHIPVQRVVSVAPTLTEIVCALDACTRLVGVTRFDDYPPEVKSIAKIGGFVDPSLEAIAKLKPDVVLLTKNGANKPFVASLDRLGIAWIAFSDETLDDFQPITNEIARLLGKSAGDVNARSARALEALQTLPKINKRALMVYGHAPLIVAGPGSFGAQMLERVGLQNAYLGSARYPTLDFETLARMKPDVIIDVDMDGGGKSSTQYWDPVRPSLGAVFLFAPDPALMRLGPRLPSSMQALRSKLDTALRK